MVGAQNLIGIDRGHGSVCRFTVSHGAAHHGAALGREVAGVRKGDDRYGRVLATGFVAGESLNDRIVREGWALGLPGGHSALVIATSDIFAMFQSPPLGRNG